MEAAPGTYKVTIRAHGYAPAKLDRVEVSEGRPTAVGDVVLPKGSTIAGIVADAAGKPVPGARVFAGDRVTGNGAAVDFDGRDQGGDPLSNLGPPVHTTVTEADGRFSIRGAHAERGRFAVVAEDSEGRVSPVTVVAVAEDIEVEIRVHAPGSLSGAVSIDGRSRGLIDVVASPVSDSGARGREPAFFVAAAVDGRYRFERLAPGVFAVFADDPAAPPGEAARVDIESNRERSLDLRIE